MSQEISLKQLTSQYQNIAIIIGDISPEDSVFAVIALTKLLSNLGITFQVISNIKPKKVVKQILEEYGVNIFNEIAPNSYTVSIDYGDNSIDKIVYDTDKEKSKLVFKIIPSKGGFDFKNVQFEEGSKKFDACILINIEDFKTLGDIYDKNEYVFKEIPSCKIADSNSVCQALSLILPENSPKDVYNLLFQTILSKISICEGNVDPQTWQSLSQLAQNGIDISYLIRKKYYSKSSKMLNLTIKMMQNCKMNKGLRVIWSQVSSNDLKYNGVDETGLDLIGRIPFNISIDFDLAFEFFETDKNTVVVVVESNDLTKYSASVIAGVFGGKGDNCHATMKLANCNLNTLDKQFWHILNDLYGLDLTSEKNEAPVKIVDNSDKRLTKACKNSKNKGLEV